MAADRPNSFSLPDIRAYRPHRLLEWQQRNAGDRGDPFLWARLPPNQLPQNQSYTSENDEDRAWERACDEMTNETGYSRRNNGHPAARSTMGLMVRIPRSSQSPSGNREQTPAPRSLPTKHRPGWPKDALPTELFEKIAGDLARDDISNMRLVNHEFEKKVSGFLFKAVVVPFQRQIYGISTRKAIRKKAAIHYEKEEKAEENGYKNANQRTEPHEGDDHDGMEVFKAWGPHIKKFAISFEFDEGEMVPGAFVVVVIYRLNANLCYPRPDVLYNPPVKDLFDVHNSFWGEYSWHRPNYTRYTACENLENKADEDRAMVTAFSHLSEVSELGLSLDGGLGWLVGPDKSDRARIFNSRPEIFGSRFPPSSVVARRRCSEWSRLKIQELSSDSSETNSDDREDYPPLVFGGLNLDSPTRATSDEEMSRVFQDRKPYRLTMAQQEWLLEMHWAQNAFLTSWCMAIVDNAAIFKNLKVLKIARLSSRYLESLKRQDFWTALKNLEDVTVMVLPDWRDVSRFQGSPQTIPILPSAASDSFFDLLQQCIAGQESLTKLRIGYAAGGERAQGIHARNKHILQAPIAVFTQPQKVVDEISKILTFHHVEHLTISNCWFTPDILKLFVLRMRDTKLKTLVLDSVSLTAPTSKLKIVSTTQDPSSSVLEDVADTSEMPVPSLIASSYTQRLYERKFLNPNPGPVSPWLSQKNLKNGSWPDVINTLTPGETLNEKRFLFGLDDQPPPPRYSGSLREIKFNSCGYVRLRKLQTFNQTSLDRLGPMEINPVPALARRAMTLSFAMMPNEDKFLGQIATSMESEEKVLLSMSFGMTHGWGDDEARLHTREDNQPLGGSGRFNGSIITSEDAELVSPSSY